MPQNAEHIYYFFILSAFVYTTVFYGQNTIGDIECRGTVGDDKTRFIPQTADIFQQFPFRIPVERGSSLVQKQNGTFGQDRSRDGEPLRLSLRKSATAFRKRRLQTLRQFPNELRASDPQSFLDFFVQYFGVILLRKEGQIFIDSSREQEIALRHVSEQTAVFGGQFKPLFAVKVPFQPKLTARRRKYVEQ